MQKLRPTQTAINRDHIEHKSKVLKEKIMNPLKFKKNITRRDLTEQKISESVQKFNTADAQTALNQQSVDDLFIGSNPYDDSLHMSNLM
jgi:MOSC domain-containing protein YiiM